MAHTPAMLALRLTLALLLTMRPAIAWADTCCELEQPPEQAGENQAHGVILYIYPRNSQMGSSFSGCQARWFYDNDHFRKLDIVSYQDGKQVAYDKLRIDGKLSYRCRYKDQLPAADNDGRCPSFELLDRSSYRAGCHALTSATPITCASRTACWIRQRRQTFLNLSFRAKEEILYTGFFSAHEVQDLSLRSR